VLVDKNKLGESVFNAGVIAFEVCGQTSPWYSRNKNRTDDDGGFFCPSGNTCCRMQLNDGCSGGEGETCNRESWGCIASDMGAKNATCCSQDGGGNTGCPSGYECRRNEDNSNGTAAYDCLRKPATNTSGDDDGGDPFMRVLPRYFLCLAEESNRKIYGLPVEAPSPSFNDSFTIEGKTRIDTDLRATTTSKLAYYSNMGPIESNPKDQTDDFDDNRQILAGVEMAFVIVHGANRNGDDYFCSAKATIELQNRYENPAVLIIAPLFLSSPRLTEEDTVEHKEKLFKNNSASFLYWKDTNDKDGSWRYGADATGPVGASSFDAMDAIVTTLKSTSKLPNLRRIVVAGHSSGGQFVQRWSLLTPPEVWPPMVSPTSNSVAIHAVVANPSSYAYLTPLRFFDKDGDKNNSIIDTGINSVSTTSRSLRTQQNSVEGNWNMSSWRIPSREDCSGYNQWEWGLDDGGNLDVPYRKRAFSRQGRADIIDHYLRHRSVTYLIGNLDRCSNGEGKTQVKPKRSSNSQLVVENVEQCDSHGLETTCADELQGKNRYERNARYWTSLELVTASLNKRGKFVEEDGGIEKASSMRHNHHRSIIQNVGHDHSMMFQSKEGIAAIYYSN